MGVLVVVGLIVSRGGSGEGPAAAVESAAAPPASEGAQPTSPDETALDDRTAGEAQGEAVRDGVVEVADDGRTLWVSPTAGQPLAIDHLPSRRRPFSCCACATS